MEEVSIYQAMRLRNRLKTREGYLRGRYAIVPKLWNELDTPDYSRTGGLAAHDIIEQLARVVQAEKLLHTAIEEANTRGVMIGGVERTPCKVMGRINYLKEMDEVYSNVLYTCEKFVKRERDINPVTGEDRVTDYATDLDAKSILQKRKAIADEIFSEETLLGTLNARVIVDMDGTLLEGGRTLRDEIKEILG